MKTQKFDLNLKLKMEEILEAKLEAMEDMVDWSLLKQLFYKMKMANDFQYPS